MDPGARRDRRAADDRSARDAARDSLGDLGAGATMRIAQSASRRTTRASSSSRSRTARRSRRCSSRASPARRARCRVPSKKTPTRRPRSTTRTTNPKSPVAEYDPRHAVHLDAGRLRDGLRLLRERRRRAEAPPAAPTRSSRRCSSAARASTTTSDSATSSSWAWASRSTTTTRPCASLRLLTHPDGIGLSARRVTVSTSGLVPEIARLGEDFGGQIGLAISLHAADDETRSRLMPINKKYPLAELMDALRALSAAEAPPHHDRVHARRRQERHGRRGAASSRSSSAACR